MTIEEQITILKRGRGNEQTIADLRVLESYMTSSKYGTPVKYETMEKGGKIHREDGVYFTSNSDHYATEFNIYDASNDSVGHIGLETPRNVHYLAYFQVSDFYLDKNYEKYKNTFFEIVTKHLPHLKRGLLFDEKFANLPIFANCRILDGKLIFNKQ